MHAPDVLSNKSFFVAFADGALKAECSSAACPDTLLLFKQTVNLLVQSVARAWRPSEDSRPDHVVAPPLTQTVTAVLSSASALSGYRQSVDVRTASAPQPISPAGVHWLSDVIDDWHENGGVKFSAETWDYAYQPSFRIFRELVGDCRRDRELKDGSMQPSLLDLRLQNLTRAQVGQFHEHLKELPARQGGRDDGKEAMTRILEAIYEKWGR